MQTKDNPYTPTTPYRGCRCRGVGSIASKENTQIPDPNPYNPL